MTQAAHNEMRAYIRSARSISPSDGDFLESLRNDILHFEQRSGIPTELFTNLELTERTIKYHMGKIIELLHLENRSQVIAYAVKMGIVSIRHTFFIRLYFRTLRKKSVGL